MAIKQSLCVAEYAKDTIYVTSLFMAMSLSKVTTWYHQRNVTAEDQHHAVMLVNMTPQCGLPSMAEHNEHLFNDAVCHLCKLSKV